MGKSRVKKYMRAILIEAENEETEWGHTPLKSLLLGKLM